MPSVIWRRLQLKRDLDLVICLFDITSFVSYGGTKFLNSSMFLLLNKLLISLQNPSQRVPSKFFGTGFFIDKFDERHYTLFLLHVTRGGCVGVCMYSSYNSPWLAITTFLFGCSLSFLGSPFPFLVFLFTLFHFWLSVFLFCFPFSFLNFHLCIHTVVCFICLSGWTCMYFSLAINSYIHIIVLCFSQCNKSNHFSNELNVHLYSFPLCSNKYTFQISLWIYIYSLYSNIRDQI